ncbi:MAG TPA: hypothetical protein VF149_00220 [Bacillales bacterium]
MQMYIPEIVRDLRAANADLATTGEMEAKISSGCRIEFDSLSLGSLI